MSGGYFVPSLKGADGKQRRVGLGRRANKEERDEWKDETVVDRYKMFVQSIKRNPKYKNLTKREIRDIFNMEEEQRNGRTFSANRNLDFIQTAEVYDTLQIPKYLNRVNERVEGQRQYKETWGRNAYLQFVKDHPMLQGESAVERIKRVAGLWRELKRQQGGVMAGGCNGYDDMMDEYFSDSSCEYPNYQYPMLHKIY